jgi:hypothetical protein
MTQAESKRAVARITRWSLDTVRGFLSRAQNLRLGKGYHQRLFSVKAIGQQWRQAEQLALLRRVTPPKPLREWTVAERQTLVDISRQNAANARSQQALVRYFGAQNPTETKKKKEKTKTKKETTTKEATPKLNRQDRAPSWAHILSWQKALSALRKTADPAAQGAPPAPPTVAAQAENALLDAR